MKWRRWKGENKCVRCLQHPWHSHSPWRSLGNPPFPRAWGHFNREVCSVTCKTLCVYLGECDCVLSPITYVSVAAGAESWSCWEAKHGWACWCLVRPCGSCCGWCHWAPCPLSVPRVGAGGCPWLYRYRGCSAVFSGRSRGSKWQN